MSEFRTRHAREHIDNEMVIIEVNLDDCSGETLSYTMDRLFAAGANDVYYTSIYMKKNRPAYKLSVLSDKKKQPLLEEIIFRETSSFGLRYYPVSCHRLGREFYQAETAYGEVSVKIGIYQGEPIKFSPEFEDCRKAAEKHNVSLQNVYDEAKSMATMHYKS
ncbi:nickel insertion protein [Fictibacillus fluitans]|uniref:DUF111 family protein n=1 Tax=Fictibacillus fluitans TaxID=3058422 RepID=A0ABT8HU06_9BACL|nr:nickel insertion protein [Fictibacillus sp. NE201]MDN4524248.1 DUF111 family protein [Fictibacillus sp. NE201]